MKSLKFITFCILLSLVFYNCNNESVFDGSEIPDVIVDPDPDPDPDPGPRTLADLQEDFSNIDFVTGINDVSLENLNGGTWSFRVIMPDVDFTNNDRPLILSLHGCAACGVSPEAHKFTGCLAEAGFTSINAIILSPNSNGEIWITENNYNQVTTLMDLASTYLPVDTGKIVAHGYSDGGNGSWFFAETASNVFSASIPMASHYNTINNGVGRLIPIPMYVIHGTEDALFPIEQVRVWVGASIDSGSDITMVEAPGLTHPAPCDYVSYLEVAAEWLVNDVWN